MISIQPLLILSRKTVPFLLQSSGAAKPVAFPKKTKPSLRLFDFLKGEATTSRSFCSLEQNETMSVFSEIKNETNQAHGCLSSLEEEQRRDETFAVYGKTSNRSLFRRGSVAQLVRAQDS